MNNKKNNKLINNKYNRIKTMLAESTINTEKVNSLFNDIQNLTILETSELLKLLTNMFGIVPSSGDGGGGAAASDTPKPPVEEEKPIYNLIIKSVPSDKKISILKVVRVITGLGLKESKDIVDTVPQVVKKEISKEDSEKFVKDLTAAGAEIELEKVVK
jgi:large subunit ribosomal protein L7/L12